LLKIPGKPGKTAQELARRPAARYFSSLSSGGTGLAGVTISFVAAAMLGRFPKLFTLLS
jgi:hypothetical protein